MCEFQKLIGKIPNEDIQRLLSFIPQIENSKMFGSLAGGQKITENFYFESYTSPTEMVSEFARFINDKIFLINFDWSSWSEGSNTLNDPATNYSKLDNEFLIRLLIAIVRNDRFCDGYLVFNFENGKILTILKALEMNL